MHSWLLVLHILKKAVRMSSNNHCILRALVALQKLRRLQNWDLIRMTATKQKSRLPDMRCMGTWNVWISPALKIFVWTGQNRQPTMANLRLQIHRGTQKEKGGRGKSSESSHSCFQIILIRKLSRVEGIFSPTETNRSTGPKRVQV